MECLFAVEFSVNKPKNYHIVGFGFDPEYPPMKKYLADMALRQTDNTYGVFNEGVEKGGKDTACIVCGGYALLSEWYGLFHKQSFGKWFL